MCTGNLIRRIGQLFMVGFHGTTPNKQIRTLIEDYHVGGIILFSRNIESPKQVRNLTSKLQDIAAASGHNHPLFISTDQEGGLVNRITKQVPVSPGNMALGAINRPEKVRKVGSIMAKSLKYLGINMDLAPVLDRVDDPSNHLGTRCFGTDPKLVGKMGKAFAEGLGNQGVAPIGKHFLGYGGSRADPHHELPVNSSTPKDLAQDLVPFESAADRLTGIMSAHIVLEAYDELPATMSSQVLTELLREQLNYDGLIVTDCLEMDAIAKKYGTKQAARQVITAGGDLLLVSHHSDVQQRTIESITEEVSTGNVTKTRIEESLSRIVKTKQQLSSSETIDNIDFPAHQRTMDRIGAAGTTVLRKADLPLEEDGKPILALVPKLSDRSLSPVEDEKSRTLSIKSRLQNQNIVATELAYTSDLANFTKIKQRLRQTRQVIILSLNPNQVIDQLVKVSKCHTPSQILVGTDRPWGYQKYPVNNLLLTYGFTKSSLNGLALVLSGRKQGNQSPPVNLSSFNQEELHGVWYGSFLRSSTALPWFTNRAGY